MAAELRTFVDIDASPERVWDVLTDVPAMPAWNPFVVQAEGTFAVGERLSLRLPRLASVGSGQTEAASVLEDEPHQDDAPDRDAPGHAGDHPADRQRDDRDAQGHLAA